MDARRFEDLIRVVGRVGTRRALIGALAGSAAGLGLGLGRGDEAAAGVPIINCKVPGKQCSSNRRCCSGRCRKERCQCSKKGRPCWTPLEGGLCCSGRCDHGKCA